MDRFNLNLFFALDAILHADTLTEAAHNVHLSQPAMSVSLKKLRAYFEDELVVYQGGETRFTALAEVLKPRIREVLQRSREALALDLSFDPASDVRTVRITAPDVVEVFLLNRLTAQIASSAPGIEMVSLPFAYRPVDAIFRDNVDMAVVSEAFALPQFETLPLFDETISVMVWEGSQAIGDTLTERQYYDARHAAMYFSAERLAHPVGAALQGLSAHRRIAMRASAYSALPHMIVGTDLLVTTLTRFATFCARTMPIRVVPLPFEMPIIPFVAQWQRYRSDEPVIRWLSGELKRAAQGL